MLFAAPPPWIPQQHNHSTRQPACSPFRVQLNQNRRHLADKTNSMASTAAGSQQTNLSQANSPSPPCTLPPEKVFSIQVGTKLFRLSGASIASDGQWPNLALNPAKPVEPRPTFPNSSNTNCARTAMDRVSGRCTLTATRARLGILQGISRVGYYPRG